MLPLVALALLAAPPELPAAWHGTWAGTMLNTPADGQPTLVPMGLTVRPLAGGRLTWTISYGEGEKQQVRGYELVPGDKPGRFVVDEKSGITLPARLAGDTLHLLFKVGDSHLVTRYQRAGDAIRFELVSFAPDPAAGGMGVTAFQARTVQTAELKRQP